MATTLIESSSNPRFRSYLSLTSSKGIKKLGQFLISGERIVKEALYEKDLQIDACLLTSEMTAPKKLSAPTLVFSKSLFKELDVLGTNAPLLVGRCPETHPWNLEETHKHRQCLLALQDPSNLGAALRICEAFEVHSVVLLQEAASPFHPKAIRASAGSSFRLKLLKGPSIQDLPKTEYVTLCLEGESLSSFPWPEHFRLVLGEEGAGVPSSLIEMAKPIHIPMKNNMNSLNAVSALSIALFSSYTK